MIDERANSPIADPRWPLLRPAKNEAGTLGEQLAAVAGRRPARPLGQRWIERLLATIEQDPEIWRALIALGEKEGS